MTNNGSIIFYVIGAVSPLTYGKNRRFVKIGVVETITTKALHHRINTLEKEHKCKFQLLFACSTIKVVEDNSKEMFKSIRIADGDTEAFWFDQELGIKDNILITNFSRWVNYLQYVPNKIGRNSDKKTIEDLHETIPIDSLTPMNPKNFRDLPVELGFIPGHDTGPREKDDVFPELEFSRFTVDDYYIPPEYIDVVRELFGAIDLDPSSHPTANMQVKAITFYTISDNGLEKEWYARVWLNPPFSAWPKWAIKFEKEWITRNKKRQNGRTLDEVCLIASARTINTKYFHKHVLKYASAFVILRGRVQFLVPLNNNKDDSAPWGCVIFYFGPNIQKFYEVFNKLGEVGAPVY